MNAAFCPLCQDVGTICPLCFYTFNNSKQWNPHSHKNETFCPLCNFKKLKESKTRSSWITNGVKKSIQSNLIQSLQECPECEGYSALVSSCNTCFKLGFVSVPELATNIHKNKVVSPIAKGDLVSCLVCSNVQKVQIKNGDWITINCETCGLITFNTASALISFENPVLSDPIPPIHKTDETVVKWKEQSERRRFHVSVSRELLSALLSGSIRIPEGQIPEDAQLTGVEEDQFLNTFLIYFTTESEMVPAVKDGLSPHALLIDAVTTTKKERERDRAPLFFANGEF